VGEIRGQYPQDCCTDSVAAAKATKLVQQDQVDVILGGIYSSTRQAIKAPAVEKGKTLYIYPEQYEGGECDPLIFCTGAGARPAGGTSHSLADAQNRSEEVLPAVSGLYLASHREPEGS
jgi:ABC-type branched-subunit amino acid transport system substrate-binding protein